MEPQIPNSESESEYSSSSPPPKRPNRWEGNSLTYLRFISDERDLASSVEQTRNQDLSIHLYNAHALKRRARLFWERKERGEIFDEEGEGMAWAPPRAWTAWPMGPDEVPREGEVVGGEDEDEIWTFKRAESGGMCADLEEELLAATLREASKRFEAREEDVEGEGSDQIMEDPEDETDTVVKEPSEAESKILLKPIISADDARSANILRPSIRHTLYKLDELLMALHHARATCHQITSRSAANTDDESVFNDESPSKRPRGRPRKFANLALLQRDGSSPAPPPDPTSLFRAKKTHIGRPQKVYPHIDGETQQEYLVRIARIQKKPLPSFAVPLPASEPGSPSVASRKSRKSPAKRATEDELNARRKRMLGLRDWSEVIGMAALVGFSPDVVQRATKRCVDLFGEGMTLRTLNEVGFEDEGQDFSTTYLPDKIPDFGDDDESSESNEDESEVESPMLGKRKVPTDLEDDSWYCPLEVCRVRNQGGFEFSVELRRHMSNVHKMEKDEIDELVDDEVMDGAVHNDGFLEPMRCRRGVRGEGKAKGMTNKKMDTSSDDSAEDEQGNGEEGQEEEEETSTSESSDEEGEGDGPQDDSVSS